MVRTFAADIADELEAYGFHQPPALAADGLIGLEHGTDRQDLKVDFAAASSAESATGTS